MKKVTGGFGKLPSGDDWWVYASDNDDWWVYASDNDADEWPIIAEFSGPDAQSEADKLVKAPTETLEKVG